MYDSEYAGDTVALFLSREAIQKYDLLMLVKYFALCDMETRVGDREVMFVAAASPSCSVDKLTFNNADLSDIDLGNGFTFPIVVNCLRGPGTPL